MSTDSETKNVSQISTDGEAKTPNALKRPHIYDGDYFEIVSREKDGIIVRCRMCGPEGALLKAALTSSSNILKHVKRKHPDQMNKMKVEKRIKSRTSRSELRLKVLNTGCTTSKTAKTYPGPSMKIKQQTLSELDNEVADITELNSTDDNEQVYEFDFDDKIDERSIEMINYEEETFASPLPMGKANAPLLAANRELLETQKQLMEREHNYVYEFRLERHQLEMSILKAELAHKTVEHQKRMDILNKKLQNS